MPKISGFTKQNNIPTQCLIRLYERNSGVLVDETLSDAVTGEYTLYGVDPSQEFDVVCIGDSSVCPSISGPISPTPTPVDEIFTNGELGGYWDFSQPNLMFSDVAGNTPISDGLGIAKINDGSGNNNHLIQSNAIEQFTWNQDGYAQSNGSSSIGIQLGFSVAPESTLLIVGDVSGISNSAACSMTISDNSVNNQSVGTSINDGSNVGPIGYQYDISFNSSSIPLTTKTKHIGLFNIKSSNSYIEDQYGNVGALLTAGIPSNCNDLNIGKLDRPNEAFYLGKYHFALYVNRILTTQEKTDIMNFLTTKFQIPTS